MPALSTDAASSASDTLTPAERARAAALARFASPSPSTSPPVSRPEQAHSPQLTQESFNPSRADVLPFHKTLDSQLLPRCSKPQAVKTLETLQTLLSNILVPPNPAAASKYRQLRLSNSLVKSNLVDPAGGAGVDYLIAAGMRSQKIEFVEYLTFFPAATAAQLHKLRVAEYVVREKLKNAREAEEREKRYRESEKTAEAARKEKALLAAEEDRLRRAEKDEREKLVRSARPPPTSTYTVRPTSPGRWAREAARQGRGAPYPDRGRGGGGARIPAAAALDQAAYRPEDEEDEEMGMDGGDGEGEEEEEEEEDLPPSYGELHGRVLGTGLPPGGEASPPAGVNMVNRQDLEE
ncbi:hypothetical protein JCM10213_007824 [Rhodosporidiobolus nylandii]